MRILKLRSVSAVPVVVMLVAAGFLLSGKSQVARTKLPAGNWTFSAGPYFGPGYDVTPIDVQGVTTSAARGLSIERVSLLNRTSKQLKEVTLRWYLREKSRNMQLLEGETEVIEIGLPAGKQQQISYPVVSFAKIYRPFLKNGVLEGEFRIEVVVARATFADGSQWKLGDLKFSKANHSRLSTTEGCQKQGCKWNGPESSYICTANEGTYCSVTEGGQSCTESRCALEEP